MNIVTYEGVVENGQVRLPAEAKLPENAKVYVVVPEPEAPRVVRIASPRVAHREDAAEFIKMEVLREGDDADP
jgi:hypothetical protein